jgi:hypothetical protein
MFPAMLAVAVAMALAGWSWRDRLGDPRARWAALARTLGLAVLLLLLLDPGITRGRIGTRPLVLLDNSVSMHAGGGDAAAAATLAASIGDTTTFGELARGEPAGRTDLFAPLAGAVAGGRPVVVVTDGEVGDASAIPADLLAQATVRLLPRARGSDIGLTEIRAPLRLTSGDTLTIDVAAVRTPDAPDTATVLVRDSSTILLRGMLKFQGAARTRLRLAGALPKSLQGQHWLRIERAGPSDAEPGDDVRWWKLVVTPTPGVVVLAEAPDWDARALYRTLKDVVEVPIRGYAQLQRGQWRRMDDLQPVPSAEVNSAARSADLLAVRGDTRAWTTVGKARLLWAPADAGGDWYLGVGGASPINGAFSGVDADSLPASPAVHPVAGDTATGWVGAVARLARRGASLPVIAGHEDRSGRTVTIGADGLFRWTFRGGVADQVWRTMIAEAATWLLASPSGDSMRARPTSPVTQRGRAMHFRWTGGGAATPLAIRLRASSHERTDSLRFDGEGDASLALPVGRYEYSLEGGGSGTFAVEPYSDELVPGPPTLSPHSASVSRAAPRRSLRELVWLFGIAIAAFGCEWLLRRRMGLR